MPPYVITDELRRFSQRYTSFSRAHWDPTCAACQKRGRTVQELNASGKRGYSRQDFAMQTGAWAVARQRVVCADDGRRPGEMAGAESEQRGRFEPDDWTVLTNQVKCAARLYGAAMVGITKVDPLWVYACNGDEEPLELPDGMDTAVVIAVAMDYRLIRTSPAVPASAATGNGYSRMAFTGACLVKYLTDLGFQAKSSGNDTALSIPLAIDAGLGEAGRNGLLITAPFGPRVRLCKVFTDAPLIPDKPISLGVTEFCQVCLKCVDACPSASIPRGAMTDAGPTPSNNNGALKWYVNADTCLRFWRLNGTSCANCIRSCPFNKLPGLHHDVARELIKLRLPLVNGALVKVDDWLGYGRQVVV